MIDTGKLNAALSIGRIPDAELADILGSLFPLAKWESGMQVSYYHPDAGHVLDLVYSKGSGRILRSVPGPGLTNELLAQISDLIEKALSAPDAELEIRREILFSLTEIRGYWRHGDDWQILPAPANAPRPRTLMGKHPFVLEYKIRSSSIPTVAIARRLRRLWELHLVLSLLLRGHVTRQSSAAPHHWVLLGEPQMDGSHTAYVNEGYIVDGFASHAKEFSETAGLEMMPTVPDVEYYSRSGIRVDGESMPIPEGVDEFFDRFESSTPPARDQFLRACYWLDVASLVWHTSKSLSFVAAINAVEALAPPRGPRSQCSSCGLDKQPGPSAHFRDTVETYAAAEGADARSKMYTFRSNLVHGGVLHSHDAPTSWGALIPAAMQERQWHDAAFAVARTAIRNWFMNTTAIPPQAETDTLASEENASRPAITEIDQG